MSAELPAAQTAQLPGPGETHVQDRDLHAELMVQLHGLTRACAELGRGYERLAATCCMNGCVGQRGREDGGCGGANEVGSPQRPLAPREPLAPQVNVGGAE